LKFFGLLTPPVLSRRSDRAHFASDSEFQLSRADRYELTPIPRSSPLTGVHTEAGTSSLLRKYLSGSGSYSVFVLVLIPMRFGLGRPREGAPAARSLTTEYLLR
jgi:hypothetical protein